MIGLDGCFIKTPYGGQLLTAIGWDPNDKILPIFYAVVEAKIKDSWRWFLLNLCDDLGVDKIRWSSKKLITAFDELLSNIDHRFCKAAKATYVQEWERRMKEIQLVDQGAYNHLMEIPAKYWNKSMFNHFPRVDTLVNNICEYFNSVIVEAREKHIVSMLEDIRVYLMNRWADNRQSIVTHAGEILPKINKKIEREFDKGGEWLAIYAGRDKYEVSTSQCNRDKFVVDLNLHECSCRKFKLTGYPCEHAMSCIRKMCLDVKNYVNKCCRKETYVDCNQHVIYPVNRPNLWTQTENDDVLSLVFRKPIERPKLKVED
ncbi:uncharacterized protein LOC110273590 [Arachis duranensis]|uniref:Uncharacterized protein LOC110273590 n=1 Tax=Arachis duranensis TaxID=130453 RepID=A0A6P5MHH8_ARADU|nr:uncharacterized protein LOC110273590 [Arachis duranensis]